MQAGDRLGARALVTDQMLQLGVFGTPAEVIRRLEVVAAAGVTHISLGGPLGPDPESALTLLWDGRFCPTSPSEPAGAALPRSFFYTCDQCGGCGAFVPGQPLFRVRQFSCVERPGCRFNLSGA